MVSPGFRFFSGRIGPSVAARLEKLRTMLVERKSEPSSGRDRAVISPKIGVRNPTSQYTQVGNAVPPYLAAQIARVVADSSAA
jgi:site-specific DNA-cytosine methylase